MKKLVLSVLFLAICISANAQEKPKEDKKIEDKKKEEPKLEPFFDTGCQCYMYRVVVKTPPPPKVAGNKE